jgi:hypothetical protein
MLHTEDTVVEMSMETYIVITEIMHFKYKKS